MKGGRLYYDMPIGILCLESLFPKPRGHMRNPLTYGFPTVTRVIRGVDIPRLLFNPTPDLLEPFIQAAKELEADGVQAITGSCGFMATFPPSPRPSSARSTSPSTTSIRSSSTPITPSAGRTTSQLSGNGDSAVPPPPEAFPPLLSEGLLFFPMGVGGIIFLGDRGSPQGGSSSPQTPPAGE